MRLPSLEIASTKQSPKAKAECYEMKRNEKENIMELLL
jgi:hypothetical protein